MHLLARWLKGVTTRRTYPLVRQYDRADCGPAALLSVLKTLGGNAPFPHVRRLCGTGSTGSSMRDLLVAAGELGLDARGATGDYESLQNEPMPCIAHVITETFLPHFVVLYRVRPSGVFMGDPGKGRMRLSREEFLSIWKSKVVLLVSPKAPVVLTEGDALPAWLLSLTRGNGPWLLQTVFLGIVTTLLGLFAASSVQVVLDRLIPEKRLAGIMLVAILLGLMVVLKAGLGYYRQKFLAIAGKAIAERISGEFLGRIFHLPKEFYSRRRTGDITSRLGDAAKVQQAFVRVLSSAFLDVFVLTGSLTILAFLSLPLLLCTLAVIPVFVCLMIRNARNITEQNHEVLGAYARVEAGYIDALNGIDEILNKKCGDHFGRASIERFSRFQSGLLELGFTQARLSFIAELCSNVLSFTMLAVGSLLVVDGVLLIGQMMAAFSLSAFAFPSVLRLVESGVAYNSASIAMQRLRDMYQTETEGDAGRRGLTIRNGIEIRDGTFEWNRRAKLFEEISLSLDRGTLTALWGPSGSGKSTLADILLRKIPLTSGRLLVDDVEAEGFCLEAYRDRVGMIPQEPRVYHATLLENILLGRSGVQAAEVHRTIRNMGLERFFERFQGGSGAMVGEDGFQLSWGERQVIAILRALVRMPDVLIVDEALTGLDIGLEEGIMEYLRSYAQEHAVLLITHDREKIAAADRVYVLTCGRISPALSRIEASARISSLAGY